MEVAGTIGHSEGAGLGGGGVGGVGLVGEGADDDALPSGLLDGLGRPLAGVEEGDGVAGGGEVDGDGGELAGGAAGEEEDAVAVRNAGDGAQGRLGIGGALDEVLAAVGDLEHAHARAPPVRELGGGPLEDGQRELGGTGGEVVHAHVSQ